MFTITKQTQGPSGIALDEENRKIFWGGEGDNGGAFVTNMDGTSTRRLSYGPAFIYNVDLDSEQQ